MDNQLVDQSMDEVQDKIKLEFEECAISNLDDYSSNIQPLIDDYSDKIEQMNDINDVNDLKAELLIVQKDKLITENNETSEQCPANNQSNVDNPTNDQQSIDQLMKEEEDEENKEHCEDFVNFAIICSFFQQFGTQIGVNYSIETLKEMLENNKKISDNLIELHVKLLRKIKKYVNKERWENGLVKFLFEFSHLEAWQLEATGYQNIGLQFKIDLLKRLLEAQFDYNQKFKTEINNIETLLLRLVPIGRDLNGNQYWYHLDEEHTLRIYREQPNKDRNWKLICEDKDQFTQLIDNVESGQTEVCPVEVSSSTPTSDNEEEKTTTTKKKRGRKGKNKQVNKQVNGHKEDDRTLNNCLDSDQKSNQIQTPNVSIKEEKPRRGRKPLNRNLFKSSTEHQNNRSIGQSNDLSSNEIKIEQPVIIKQEKIIDVQQIDENIEQIVQQTINSLLDQIDFGTEKNTSEVAYCINDFKSDTLNESTTTQDTATKGKRGRKKKGALNELSKLLGDNAPKNIEDLMPIKRSSRIQKLQEKKTAEMKMQMELEQKKLEEFNKMKKLKSKKDNHESAIVHESEQEFQDEEANVLSDDSDESFKIINKSRKKDDDSTDDENELTSVKKKKKRGRKSKKEKLKLEVKKSKKGMKGGWSSNDEDLFNYYEEEEEEPLKFDDKEDEFACEEMEEDAEPVILKRARTARKAKTEDSNEAEENLNSDCINDDTPCQKCNLYTNPEWILLCDNCDLGYHTECLVPKLYIIPDGDWFCPKCENEQLLTKLKFEFENYVSNLAKREREQLRKERLKYVEINIGNILIEDSANRKNKAVKKKYNEDEYDSDLEDSDLDDDDEDNSDGASSNFDSDDSTVNRRRKKYSNDRRRNRVSGYERRSRPVAKPKVQRQPQRKRRKSYSDESDDESNSDALNSSQDDAASSNSSLPKQRSARKRVSYQFKEYDDLINSAIQASDYEYEDNEENEDQEDEEDSDDGKSFSRGKNMDDIIANMKADNPFETKENDELKVDDQVNVISDVHYNDTNNAFKKELNDADGQDERKVVVPDKDKQQKDGKQRQKRKLNDLDSPIEEAENDSDFTIKDESNTELEDDETEMESNEFSNETEEDDTDLSDWARSTKRRNTRGGGHRSNKRSKRKSRRYDDSDESDYGYKTRRTSKRVTYKEMSTTEDDDFDDDYSDNSQKNKNKKSKKKKKKQQETESDEFLSEQDSDERAVIKKKTKKRKEISSQEDEFDSSGEEGKRKSRRSQKKKVYDDFTDIDESEEEQELGDEAINVQPPVINDNLQEEKELSGVTIDHSHQIEIINSQMPHPMVSNNLNESSIVENANLICMSSTVDNPPVVKKAPKIKITKPNPKLTKNQNLNNVEPFATVLPANSEHLITESSFSNDFKSDVPSSQLAASSFEYLSDESSKKKRGRQSKNTPKEPKDPNAPQSKRGRKPKAIETGIPENYLVNVNNSIKIDQTAISNSALSQLTQFAASGDLNSLNKRDATNKLLPNINPQMVAIDSVKQMLSNPLAQQQEIIARQAALVNNMNNINEKKSQSNDSSKSKMKSPKSNKSSTQSVQQISLGPSGLPTTGVSSKPSISNSSTTPQQIQANLNHPTQPSIHFPTTTQSIHGNPNAAIGAHPHSKQAIPNHAAQLINPTAQQIPAYGGLSSGQHHMPPHSLHNPYYQTHPHYPSSAHLPHYPAPGHQINNQPSQMPTNFSPQIASQLANQWRFSMPGYPPTHFYDPSFAQYFGPANYPPMGNPYYPQPPNQGVQSTLPPHPNQIVPRPNLLPTTNSAAQVNNTTTTTTTTSQSTASK